MSIDRGAALRSVAPCFWAQFGPHLRAAAAHARRFRYFVRDPPDLCKRGRAPFFCGGGRLPLIGQTVRPAGCVFSRSGGGQGERGRGQVDTPPALCAGAAGTGYVRAFGRLRPRTASAFRVRGPSACARVLWTRGRAAVIFSPRKFSPGVREAVGPGINGQAPKRSRVGGIGCGSSRPAAGAPV